MVIVIAAMLLRMRPMSGVLKIAEAPAAVLEAAVLEAMTVTVVGTDTVM